MSFGGGGGVGTKALFIGLGVLSAKILNTQNEHKNVRMAIRLIFSACAGQ